MLLFRTFPKVENFWIVINDEMLLITLASEINLKYTVKKPSNTPETLNNTESRNTVKRYRFCEVKGHT